MINRLAAIATLLAIACPLQGQTTWSQLPVYPAFLFGTNLIAAHDSLHGLVRVVDPWSSCYVWDGTQWLADAWVTAAPGSQMAYDPARDRMVLLSPTNGGAPFTTWEHNGTAWSSIPAAAPFARCHGLAWHAPSQAVVGFFNTGVAALIAGNWIAVPTGGTPPPQQSMFYDYEVVSDTVRGVIAVFDRGGTNTGCLWECDLTSGWQQVATTAVFPYARYAFDPLRNRYVAVARGSGSLVEAVWERTPGVAGAWTIRAQAPFGTDDGPAVFTTSPPGLMLLPLLGYPVMSYTGFQPALYHWHGAGCGGSIVPAFIPELSLQSFSGLPHAGGSLTVNIGHVGVASLVLLATGISDVSAAGAPLPVSLLALPSCLLRVSPDLLSAITVPASGGVFSYSMPMPGGAAALGFPFFQQALTLQNGPQPFGALTNSMRGVIGLP